MPTKKEAVPIGTRAAAWGVSAGLGMVAYVIVLSTLTDAPVRERSRARASVKALTAEVTAQCARATAKQIEPSVAEARASACLMAVLSNREAELHQKCRSTAFWAALAGIAVGGGCFALWAVRWLHRGAKGPGILGTPAHGSA